MHEFEIRVKPKDKEKIKQIADKCGLTVSEYVLQRALGYAPKEVPTDAYFHCYNKLCELLNRDLSSDVEVAALKLFDDIYVEIIDTPKQPARQICKEVTQWQAQASGPSSPD